MKVIRIAILVLLCWFFASVSAQTFATKQLVLDLEGNKTFLNGMPISLNPPPQIIEGRTLLPLREAARIFGVNLEPINGVGLRLGKLEIYPVLKLARMDGKQIPWNDVGAIVGDNLFIAVRVFESALGMSLSFDPQQRLMTLTYIPGMAVRDTTRPVARFATDKSEYLIGEPVHIVEYSYDPEGQPISLSFTGREDAYFTPGPKSISLVVTNRAGRNSDPYTVRINVKSDVLYSSRDYALRFAAIGNTFSDPKVLDYPVLPVDRQDDTSPLIVSDSPEEPNQSGVLYSDAVSGPTRLLAYHVNAMPSPARLVVLASNLETTPATLKVERLGETAATRVVAVLGQVSLMDFLLAKGRGLFYLEAGKSVVLYTSASLAQGQGINLKTDLNITGKVTLTVLMVEETMMGEGGSGDSLFGLLASLPNLERDRNHIRGTFPSAVRTLKVRFSGEAGRVVIGDGIYDPKLAGVDALTGNPVELLGNYGLTYRIVIEGASNVVGAFSPRGGMYAGAIRVNGLLRPIPENGVLYRPDTPMLFLRSSQDRNELEFVPASGSFLPINLVLYHLSDGTFALAK